MESKQKAFIIGNAKITEKYFPKLCQIALRDPTGLEKQLRSLARADGGTEEDLHSVAVNLETDLQHDALL